MPYSNKDIQIIAGVQPSTDSTPQSTPHFVESDKVRFVDGFPEKIGGWKSVAIDSGNNINGCPRTIFSYIYLKNINYLIGTHSHLYNLLGATLSNITPVKTTTTTLNNVLSTFYGTLINDPIETVVGSQVITITDASHKFIAGDIVSLSGSTAVNGITAGQINTSFFASNITPNTYQVTTAGTATSSGSGGGAAVVRASRIVSILDTNDFKDGDNVVITNLGVSVGGIPAGSINGLRRIQGTTGTGYDIVSDAEATSSVTNVGGSIDIAEQIDAGTCDPTTGSGYGLGQYGVGLYGVPKQATTPTLPSIWSVDRFGDLLVFTQGNQTELYSWDGNVGNLPNIVTNAPTEINYVFVNSNIVVTLGASGIGSRIQWSDQGNITTWTETAENRAGQDDIEGASDFISHASLRGFNLLFTREQVYSFRFIDKPFVWSTSQIDPSRGLIARNARIVVNGICYWMGCDNFYMYRGGNVEIIPSNSFSQSSVKNFVFGDLNNGNESKIFAWYNENFNEIWWHYPSLSSNEPNMVVSYNIRTSVWVTHSLERSAGEYPAVLDEFPYLAQVSGVDPDKTGIAYQHERGSDDDINSLEWSLTTPFFNSGTKPVALGGLHFDSVRNGDITVDLKTKFYPKGQEVITSYEVGDNIDKIAYRRRGRYWQYKFSGNILGQEWNNGILVEEFKLSGRK